MTASPLAACPLQPTAEGRVSAGMGMAHFASPRASSGGGPLQHPRPHFRVGDPISPSSHPAKPLSIIHLSPTGKVPSAAPALWVPPVTLPPRVGSDPRHPQQSQHLLSAEQEPPGLVWGPHQQSPSPASAGSLAPSAEPKDVPALYRGPQSSPRLPSPPSAPITSLSLSHG